MLIRTHHVSGVALYLARSGLVATLFAIAACETDGAAGDQCELNADCASGHSCVDGMCVSPPPAPTRDAGSPFSEFDAGRRDAGPALVRDAGTTSPRPDASPADGDASLAPDANPDGACGPPACVARQAYCGPLVDDCGATVECGPCPDGFECSPGENRCEPERCEPRACPSGAQCGDIDDGCGGRRSCGSGCGNSERCNYNTLRCEPNPPACEPRTCAQAAVECGDNIDDGCGGTLSCGCGSNERCRSGECVPRCEDRETDWHQFTRAVNIDAAPHAPWIQEEDGVMYDKQGVNVTLTSRQPRSDILYFRDAGLNIPDIAEVTGMEVHLDVKREGQTPVVDSLYIWQSSFSSIHRRNAPLPGISTGYRRYSWGGAGHMWGLARSVLHPARINGSTFGLRAVFRADGLTGDEESRPFVDWARVKIHYRVCRD